MAPGCVESETIYSYNSHVLIIGDSLSFETAVLQSLIRNTSAVQITILFLFLNQLFVAANYRALNRVNLIYTHRERNLIMWPEI